VWLAARQTDARMRKATRFVTQNEGGALSVKGND
jgi:hypothetical protein